MGKPAKALSRGGETPDWIDVMAALHAVDGIHLGKTMVTLYPGGTGFDGGVNVVISTTWEALPGSTHDIIVTTERRWVGHRDKSLPAFLLGGIYAHDYALGDAYQQAKMPE
jgi:hypothetical protein